MSKNKSTNKLPRGIHADDVIYEAPPLFDTIKRPEPVPISVTALRRKKGKDDIKEIDAWLIDKGTRKDFILTWSRNELNHFNRFAATAGAEVMYDGQKYECFSSAVYPAEKAYPVLMTVPVA